MAKDFYSATGPTIVPAPATTTATGDIVADNPKVIGTNFNEDIQPGDWIIDVPNLERRRVRVITSDTTLILERGFTNATALAALVVVKKDISAAVYMSLKAVGDAVVDGVTILDGFTEEFGDQNNSSSPTKLIRPRVLVSGTVVVNLQYFNNNFAD